MRISLSGEDAKHAFRPGGKYCIQDIQQAKIALLVNAKTALLLSAKIARDSLTT